jgi:hypothetical protein
MNPRLPGLSQRPWSTTFRPGLTGAQSIALWLSANPSSISLQGLVQTTVVCLGQANRLNFHLHRGRVAFSELIAVIQFKVIEGLSSIGATPRVCAWLITTKFDAAPMELERNCLHVVAINMAFLWSLSRTPRAHCGLTPLPDFVSRRIELASEIGSSVTGDRARFCINGANNLQSRFTKSSQILVALPEDGCSALKTEMLPYGRA